MKAIRNFLVLAIGCSNIAAIDMNGNLDQSKEKVMLQEAYHLADHLGCTEDECV